MSAERSPEEPTHAPRLAVGVIGWVGPVRRWRPPSPGPATHWSGRTRSRSAPSAGWRSSCPGTPLLSAAAVMAAADLVLLTVPDDVLADLVVGLADTGAVTPGQFLVHASGRYGAAVLEPATRLGALPMALHPVMTFTGSRSDLDRLAGCPFGVTAPAGAAPGRRGAGRRDGWRPDVGPRGGAPALPRGAGQRCEPSGDADRPDPGPPGDRGHREPLRAWSARCSPRPWTTSWRWATTPSPVRWRVGMPGPSPPTSRPCPGRPRRPARPTSRWPGSPPTGPWPPAGSTRDGRVAAGRPRLRRAGGTSWCATH